MKSVHNTKKMIELIEINYIHQIRIKIEMEL